jgi:hypothetical protein
VKSGVQKRIKAIGRLIASEKIAVIRKSNFPPKRMVLEMGAMCRENNGEPDKTIIILRLKDE